MFLFKDILRAADDLFCFEDEEYRVRDDRHRGARDGGDEGLYEEDRETERGTEERTAAPNIQWGRVQECLNMTLQLRKHSSS